MAAARQWLFNTLTADATLTALLPGGAANGINHQRSAPGAPYPFVIYQFMSGTDYAAVGAYRIWTNMIWLVKAVGASADPTALDAIVARIDTVLQRGSGTPASGTVWSCDRQSVIDYVEEVANTVPYSHLGATYRIYAT
jgi:hypothetical protein